MREWHEAIRISNGTIEASCTRDRYFEDPDGGFGTRPAPPAPDWRVWYWWFEKYTVFGRIVLDDEER
ncbi:MULTISPECIES: hypothetical protein [unclassified Sinorhizobium]|uniref:hypothetical protein n=1 Tax=unclassified Sinorhizobium TaxID=2613772 RepID=UPI0024C29E95|nr:MULTISPECIES: hypothetical protein [unclassified Sinorhizobium]MDK1376145.1 hypothetical protein [Sinorhizobium sp. 6-70]MDK1480318.1 hypothetical protein [Sinorhizobium sp. 6-117]